MNHISKQLPAFAYLSSYVAGNADFLSWLSAVNPELSVPECWETEKELSKIEEQHV